MERFASLEHKVRLPDSTIYGPDEDGHPKNSDGKPDGKCPTNFADAKKNGEILQDKANRAAKSRVRRYVRDLFYFLVMGLAASYCAGYAKTNEFSPIAQIKMLRTIHRVEQREYTRLYFLIFGMGGYADKDKNGLDDREKDTALKSMGLRRNRLTGRFREPNLFELRIAAEKYSHDAAIYDGLSNSLAGKNRLHSSNKNGFSCSCP